ncbi:MAG: putative porin [Sediminibacterium sp.]
MRTKRILFICCFTSCLFFGQLSAQNMRFNSFGGGGGGATDSLQKRDKAEDSIAIYYRLYNSLVIRNMDTSVNDFFSKFILPYSNYNLGNLGNASKSYLFNPLQRGGWDAGFRSYEVYNYTLEQIPFYQTTKPYTELGYLLGGKGEQLIELLHTQNKTKQFNYSFAYRFSNAPGNLKNQHANLNNMRITANYQSKRKRYASYWVMLLNKSASSENGGLVNSNLIDSLSLNNPYELDTRLGISGVSFRNPFNTSIATGTTYKEQNFVWKQTYDIGQKDSVVKDTVTTYLFYPRLRFQNEIKYQSNQFAFADANPLALNYEQYFNYKLPVGQTMLFQDQWKRFTNEFSLVSFPEKTNPNQFLQVGLGYQQLNFKDTLLSWSNHDIYGLGVYKNKTKNLRWDIQASGKLFLNGYHAGDYEALFSLTSVFNKKGDQVALWLQNSNRTPSFNRLGITTFPISKLSTIDKENIIELGAMWDQKSRGLTASFQYKLIQNFQYFGSGYQPLVYDKALSYIKGTVSNQLKLSTHWNWYNELSLQLVDPNAPLHLPVIFTRQRLAFEGNFFKNLFLSTGLELIYHSAFQPDAYMPLTGQFYLQDQFTTNNRPIANAFLNFRIKRFKGFIRMEQLNTLLATSNQLGTRYQFTAPNYLGTGTWLRVGIWWNFIN